MIRLFFALLERVSHQIDHQAQAFEEVFEPATTSIQRGQQGAK